VHLSKSGVHVSFVECRCPVYFPDSNDGQLTFVTLMGISAQVNSSTVMPGPLQVIVSAPTSPFKPNGASNVTMYSYGRVLVVTQKDSGGSQITKTTYAYDAHGRVLSTTDARNGPTTFKIILPTWCTSWARPVQV
jgi:YD repeat-containing protein